MGVSYVLILMMRISQIYCVDDHWLIQQQVDHYIQNEDDFENSAEYDAIHDILLALNLSGRCKASDFILVGTKLHFKRNLFSPTIQLLQN